MPEKDIISATFKTRMQGIKSKNAKKPAKQSLVDVDDFLTADDIAAVREGREDIRTGKAMRLATYRP